jgi:aerobic-type carbon monoxide dehydrogenase small subunit (CoxS/CutS family)
MGERIQMTVNGRLRTVELEGWEKLLDILREQLNLTGSKRGCDDATCAACTVVLNGEAVKACVTPAKKCAGGEVMTIEGLADGERLHPIQQALITSGAVQCGYCTPGIVMELYALFQRDPEAGQEEIRKALNRHLCRCTGYEAIWNGALQARELLRRDRKA